MAKLYQQQLQSVVGMIAPRAADAKLLEIWLAQQLQGISTGPLCCCCPTLRRPSLDLMDIQNDAKHYQAWGENGGMQIYSGCQGLAHSGVGNVQNVLQGAWPKCYVETRLMDEEPEQCWLSELTSIHKLDRYSVLHEGIPC